MTMKEASGSPTDSPNITDDAFFDIWASLEAQMLKNLPVMQV